jgi:hypothetical protein
MARERIFDGEQRGNGSAQAHAAFDDMRLRGVEARFCGKPTEKNKNAKERDAVDDAHAVEPNNVLTGRLGGCARAVQAVSIYREVRVDAVALEQCGGDMNKKKEYLEPVLLEDFPDSDGCENTVTESAQLQVHVLVVQDAAHT